jgi:hypothetical protein
MLAHRDLDAAISVGCSRKSAATAVLLAKQVDGSLAALMRRSATGNRFPGSWLHASPAAYSTCPDSVVSVSLPPDVAILLLAFLQERQDSPRIVSPFLPGFGFMQSLLCLPRSQIGRWLVPLFCSSFLGGMAAGQFGNTPFSGEGAAKFRDAPKPRRVPVFAPIDAKPITAVMITGRQHVPESRIRALLQTRTGRDYDPEQVQRDVRELIRSGLFQNVRTYNREVDGGIVVTFEVFERPVIQYIRFTGQRAKKEKALQKQISLRVGDPLNRFAIEEARRQLEQYYQKAGYSDAQIALAEGLGPDDHGVVFQIQEGTRQRISRVKFEGNTIVSDARLTTRIQSKPTKLWLFGGNVIPDQIEQDAVRLQAYYRSLGYFGAKIEHQQQFDDDRQWMTLTFTIQEGPRYRIRQIRVEGNQI